MRMKEYVEFKPECVLRRVRSQDNGSWSSEGGPVDWLTIAIDCSSLCLSFGFDLSASWYWVQKSAMKCPDQ